MSSEYLGVLEVQEGALLSSIVDVVTTNHMDGADENGVTIGAASTLQSDVPKVTGLARAQRDFTTWFSVFLIFIITNLEQAVHITHLSHFLLELVDVPSVVALHPQYP